MPSTPVQPGGLAPEFLTLARLVGERVRGRDDGAVIRAALERVEHWGDFVAGAARHRVVGFVSPSLLPEPAASRMRGLGRRNAQRGLRQIAELDRILAAFGQQGTRVLVLKGVALSQRLHGNPCLRGVGDLDLLIDPEDLPAAHRILGACGYHRADRRAGDLEPRLALLAKDTIYTGPDGQVVELHTRLLEEGDPPDWRFDLLWRERGTVMVEGLQVPVLGDRHLAAYLLAHGARHCWDRLCWLADVAILLADDDLRQQALAECRRQGYGREAVHAWRLTELWFAAPGDAAAESAGMRWFLRAFFSGRRWLERPRPGSRAWLILSFRQRLWRAWLSGDWRRMLRSFRRAMLNPVDHEVLRLPPRLFWLYPLLRPVGWVLRNFGRQRH